MDMLISPAEALRSAFEALAGNAERVDYLSRPPARPRTQTGDLPRPRPAPTPVGQFASISELIGAAGIVALGGPVDERLIAAAMNEGTGSDGGFLVPTEFADELLRLAASESILAQLCDLRRRSNGRSALTIPAIDEAGRADGSRWGGARAYWTVEGSQKLASKIRFGTVKLMAKKLTVLGVANEELAADAAGFDDHVKAVFRAEGGFALDRSIVFGSGVAEPLGYMNAPALITVLKETGQAPATIVRENLAKMWSRLPVASRRRAVWIGNEDAEAQIAAADEDAARPIYYPAGAWGNPWPTVFGRPLIAMEQAPPLGQLGDISVADLAQYLLLDKGIRTAMSIHVYFLEDQVVFRFVWRVDGTPAWKSPVLSSNSATTRSPFVALEPRT